MRPRIGFSLFCLHSHAQEDREDRDEAHKGAKGRASLEIPTRSAESISPPRSEKEVLGGHALSDGERTVLRPQPSGSLEGIRSEAEVSRTAGVKVPRTGLDRTVLTGPCAPAWRTVPHIANLRLRPAAYPPEASCHEPSRIVGPTTGVRRVASQLRTHGSRRDNLAAAPYCVSGYQMTRTFCASSPFLPGATSNSTRCPSSR